MKNKALLLFGGLITAFTLVILTTVVGKTAISELAGLAVAQTSSSWTSVRDGAAGDNLTGGVLASQLYFFDGVNFDRARGDVTNGLDVDVTRMPGGSFTPADGVANPSGVQGNESFTMLFNGTTWDRWRGSPTTTLTQATGLGLGNIVLWGIRLTDNVFEQVRTFGGGAKTVSQCCFQSSGSLTTTRSVSAANAAVSITISVTLANTRGHVYGVDAYCSAGTATLQITNAAGTVVLWDTPAGAVGTALFTREFHTALANPTLQNNVVVTLSTCGVGNTGTLMVRGGADIL